jgi:hypothetical protein
MWTHKVVKSQRSQAGKWFAQSGVTFSTVEDATRFAKQFAARQRAGGVGGTRINVLSRKSFVGPLGFRTHNVAEYIVRQK